MKKILILFILLLSGYFLQAQNYPYSIGYGGSNRQDADDMKCSFAGGQHTASQWKDALEGRAMEGFRFDVVFIDPTFGRNLFVSKGYYPGFVELNWEVERYSEQVTNFKIYRKLAGSDSDSTMVASVDGGVRFWRDEFAEADVLYHYTLVAQGISDDIYAPYINFIQGVGFRTPTGRVNGRVTYEGGTAVQGVNIIAETDDDLKSSSLYLNGSNSYIAISPPADDPLFKFDTAFTFQAWFRPDDITVSACLFQKGAQYSITYEPGKVDFHVGGTPITVNFTEQPDKYFQVTATYSKNDQEARLYVMYDDDTQSMSTASIPTAPASNNEELTIGCSASGDYFKGYIDEVRIWHYFKTDEQVQLKYGAFISGEEKGLSGYYRLNEGFGVAAYDLSRSGYTFNEHHAYLNKCTWSEEVPTLTQLSFKGVTDKNGNYLIAGIPYKTTGSLYHFTPMFETHHFDPTEAVLFLSDDGNTHSNVNFTDVASFPVRGNVKYKDTKFPVMGAYIKVDGRTAVTSSGEPVTTDAFGNFDVDVPIGKHNIQVFMNGHTFENEGRYPPPEPENPEPNHDFQEPVTGLQFIDNTLVKVIGRVVGGPVEAAHPLCFGKSNNNIGNAELLLSTQREADLTDNPDGVEASWSITYYQAEEQKSSGETNYIIDKDSPKNITINPDTETGEFVAYLLPERYTFIHAKAGGYTFDESFRSVLDLSKSSNWQTELDSTIIGTITLPSGEVVNEYRYDSARYQHKRNFILRLKPTISVKALDGTDAFWEKEVTVKHNGVDETVTIVDGSGNPLTDYPVFLFSKQYKFKVSVFEQYVNEDLDPDVYDDVPVSDGKIQIINNLASNASKMEFNLNSQGEYTYTFYGGMPNLEGAGDDGYTKTLNLTALTGTNGAIKTEWLPDDNVFRGYVFGGMPTGNNFVTTGPASVDMILRDPPGSGSSAFFEESHSVNKTTTRNIVNQLESARDLTIQQGLKVETSTGLGVAVINTVEINQELNIGFTHQETWVSENKSSAKTTTTQRWETSSSDDFVGANGDVFIGHSTNIVYGKSINVDLIHSDNWDGSVIGPAIGNYKIGKKIGMRVNPEFGTGFMYSQFHIENYLIPNLKDLRNHFFTQPEYSSHRNWDDPDYGENNTTETDNGDGITGDSYDIDLPDDLHEDSIFVDSIRWYNQQIVQWENLLKKNEKEKIQAELIENLSFDAGVTYQKSTEYETSEEESDSFEWMVSPKIAKEAGISVNNFGMKMKIERTYSHTETGTDGTETTEAITFGYVLADNNSGDYISVDVKKPPTQTGPVFWTRGGQTSCPYEGTTVTKYQSPGTVISEATMQRERPEIQVTNANVVNVPEDQPALFNFTLSNTSETNESSWFILSIVESTNTTGALIKMDGTPLGNGRLLNIAPGEPLYKTISLEKVNPAIFEYNNIALRLSSTCDGDIYALSEISASFQPVCTGVDITAPPNQWTINTITGKQMNVVIGNYNLSHTGFEKVLMQYKPTASSQWITDMIFYVDEGVYNDPDTDEPKQWIANNPTISYTWDTESLADRNYDIRAKSVCTGDIQNASETLSGVKDTKRPKLFGSPQPADGILSPNDEIMIMFDEPIMEGLLLPYNFTVKGVLSGYQKTHNTSLYFNGSSAYASIPEAFNLTDKSFTIEFWIKRQTLGEQVIYAHGNDIELGFDASDHFYARFGEQTLTSPTTYTATDEWKHFAVNFNTDNSESEMYCNDQILLEDVKITSAFTGEGRAFIGKSMNNDKFLDAYMHEFRVWEKAVSLGTVYSDMYTAMSGNEMGLVGYYTMEDAFGDIAMDKSRARHAMLSGTTWKILPGGSRSREFDGVDDYIEINTGATVVIDSEMDYTVEFWFNASETQAGEAIMFSNGKGDGTDNNPEPENGLVIGFTDDNNLFALNNNIELIVSDVDYLDNNWHHLALVMNRQGNLSLYIDGRLRTYANSSDFGGLAGTTMCIGSRRYNDGGVQHDQFFNGMIDEFRIWKLARKAKQLELDRNAKLKGDEKGLVAYYPFEKYEKVMGVMELHPSVDDQYIPPYEGWPTGGTATVNSGDYSAVTPNIKDARPVQSVGYDWAVNQDRIIITLTEQAEAIEKCIIEFTVEGVEDMNENRLASPVTWTAYIKKNQLIWEENQFNFEKLVYEPLVFTAKIQNLGGTEQNFFIENLPAWLEASPSEGTIAPDSELEITFTVNEGLNTGTYNETVYLRGDFNYPETLLLNLRVSAPEPNWTVNPTDYQHSMNVVGQVKIDGVLSSDKYDMVGVFVDGECRGVAHLTYIEEYDMYEVFLDIYSNIENGEILEFMLWDASEGAILSDITPVMTFAANTFEGSPQVPEILEANSEQLVVIPLPKGWKWLSLNVASSSLTQVSTALASLSPASGDLIKSKSVFDQYDETVGWAGTLTASGGIKSGELYMIKLSEKDTLRIKGTPVTPSNNPITIKTGWNWIGFLPETNMTVNEALVSFPAVDGDLIKSQTAFSMYDTRLGWIGSLTYMKSYEGYMLKATNAGTLTFPDKGIFRTMLPTERDLFVNSPTEWQFNTHEYPRNMNLVARLETNNQLMQSENDRIAAFVNGECRGIAEAVKTGDNYLYFITVQGTETPDKIEFRYLNSLNNEQFDITEHINYNPDLLLGDLRKPFPLTLNQTTSDIKNTPENTPYCSVYPNPFDDATSINFNLYEAADVKITVYDMLGNEINTLQKQHLAPDFYQLQWTGTDATGNSLSKGVYVIEFVAGSYKELFKVVKF